MSDNESNQPQRVEVITLVQRRRRRSIAEKIRIVQEFEQPGMSVSYVARKYDIAPNLLFRWRRLMREGGLSAIAIHPPRPARMAGVGRSGEADGHPAELDATSHPSCSTIFLN